MVGRLHVARCASSLQPTTCTLTGRALRWLLPSCQTLLIPRTSFLMPLTVAEGASRFPCLWLRGRLPLSFLVVETPHVMEESFSYTGFSGEGFWPANVLWTDASGGTFGGVQRLRRCGGGIASVVPDGTSSCQLDWGAWGPLPGVVQTFPRAELFAILVAAKRSDPHLPLMIVSDYEVHVKLFYKGSAAATNAANFDLSSRLWATCDIRAVPLVVMSCKGHGGRTSLERARLTH